MSLLRSAAFAVLFYAWMALLAILYLPLLLAPRSWMVAAARFWVRTSLVILRWTVGLRHEVRGLEHLPEGAAVVAAKHQSMWDTLFFHTVLADPAFILKQELTHIPFFGWYIRKHGMIAVDRTGGLKALKAMVAGGKAAADKGRQIIIFPEGTRTAPGSTQPYHSGVAMLYGGLTVPVVPVALNSGLFWGRRSFVKKPGVITVEFLPRIEAGLDRKVFVERLQNEIEAASAKLKAEAEGALHRA